MTRNGTRQSAGGTIDTSTGRKALGEKLEEAAAGFGESCPTNVGKRRQGNRRGQPKAPGSDEKKKLDKLIKASLG